MQRWLPKFQEIGKKVKIISTFILSLRSLSPLGRGKGEGIWIKMQPIFKCLSNRNKDSKTCWIDFQKLAYVLQHFTLTMLTRRDVLMELRRMGVRKPSLLKSYLRDFEKYIGNHYSFVITKTKKSLDRPSSQVSESRQNKPLYSWFLHGKALLRFLGFLGYLGLLSLFRNQGQIAFL